MTSTWPAGTSGLTAVTVAALSVVVPARMGCSVGPSPPAWSSPSRLLAGGEGFGCAGQDPFG
jgi:hypothetical protein